MSNRPRPRAGNTFVSPADVTVTDSVTLVLAARAGRRFAIIRNYATTVNVRVGGSDVSAAGAGSGKGMTIDAQDSITLETEDAIYAVAPSGYSAYVGVVECYDA